MQWYSLSLLSLSLLVTSAIHWSTNSPNKAMSLASTPLYSQNIPPSDARIRGSRLILNGREFSVAWTQWTQDNQPRLGISDTGAMQLLGLDLGNIIPGNLQAIQWFSASPQQTIPLSVRFQSPYRYLDVTELLAKSNINWSIQGDTLSLNVIPAQVVNLRQGNQTWGQRIVIDLNRPTVWQVSQTKSEGVVMLEGVTSPTLLSQFQPLPPSNKTDNDEDDLGSGNPDSTPSQLISLENTGTVTKVRVNLPTANGLQVFSLNNPPRLVIDVRPDYLPPRDIVWTKGVFWRQQFVNLKEDTFPVTWLEIDQKDPNIQLKPITGANDTLEGITPLVTMASVSNTTAAINGGFFNRNNKLPLGAIRQDQQWLSSPILNRGAIAWDEQGNVKMARLSLQETLITENGQRLPILFLNSGYLDQGLARYTPAWGRFYTTLTDNESIITIQNDQVIRQDQAVKAGNNRFNIPSDGYLIIVRKNTLPVSALPVGTSVKIDSRTNPPEMNRFPHIIGAGPLLLQNRRIVLNAQVEGFSKAFQEQKASRSAIAVHQNGKLMMVAVHHRIGGKGASLQEFAQILQKMGAVEALNLDGGSSTSLALGGQLIDRSPVTAARVHNGIGVFVNP